MSARESAEVREGLRLMDAGLSYREAAARVGVAPSSLYRARKRVNAPALPLGRRRKPEGDPAE